MRTLGQVGFDAYGDEAEWKAFDGRPMPQWDENLRADIKHKWEVAAKAIVKESSPAKLLQEILNAMEGDCTQNEIAEVCLSRLGKIREALKP